MSGYAGRLLASTATRRTPRSNGQLTGRDADTKLLNGPVDIDSVPKRLECAQDPLVRVDAVLHENVTLTVCLKPHIERPNRLRHVLFSEALQRSG
jgi:hypothetical protein